MSETLWNLFLAALPVGLAHAAVGLGRRPGGLSRGAALAVGAVWLAFLPNSCYLLTEWRHMLGAWATAWLGSRPGGEASLRLMTDTLFYSTYSGLGALAFALAIRPVVGFLRQRGRAAWAWAPGFFFLMAVGVYLGLVLRYNSWDLVYRPSLVWAAVAGLRLRPHLLTGLLLFAGFLWVLYLVTTVWIDGLLWRWGQRNGGGSGRTELGGRLS